MKNIGTQDRIMRLVIGIFLFAIAWWQGSWIVLAAALFTLFEALASWCVFYQLIGKNTCPINQSKQTNKKKDP